MPRPAKNRRIAREVIVTYYRRHARGSKVTLKELCEQAGVDYQWCRKVKMAYDAGRRRGPKRNTDDQNPAPG